MKDSSIFQRSSMKSNHKKKISTNNQSEHVFKTPPRKSRYVNNDSSSLVLSKINIEKKQKLKGFVNKQMFSLSSKSNCNKIIDEKK